MKKLSLIAGLFLLLIFVRCGNNQSSKNEANSDSVIVIGSVLPLTGNGAAIAKYIKAGLELCVDVQNSKGGIGGKKVQLIIKDSKSQPDEGVIVTQLLLKEHPYAVVSTETTLCLAIQDLLEKSKTIFIAGSSSEKLLANSKYTFRNTITTNQSADQISQLIKKVFPKSKTGIFYVNNEWGRNSETLLKQKCESFNLPVKFSTPFEIGATDYKVLINKNLNKGVDFVHLIGFGQPLGNFIKQLRTMGYKGIVSGDFTVNFPDVIKTADKYINDIYYVDFAFAENLQTDSLLIRYNTKYNESLPKLNNQTIIYFTALNTLFARMHKNDYSNKENLIMELNKTKDYSSIAGKVSVDKFEFIYPLQIKQMHFDGK